jgi:hypothetical protein
MQVQAANMVYQTNRITGKHKSNQYQQKLARYNDYALWRNISKPGI